MMFVSVAELTEIAFFAGAFFAAAFLAGAFLATFLTAFFAVFFTGFFDVIALTLVHPWAHLAEAWSSVCHGVITIRKKT